MGRFLDHPAHMMPMTVYIAPATGWSAQDLPAEPGTVIHYVNIQQSRNIAAFDDDGKTWKILRVNRIKHSRLFEMTSEQLLADLKDVLFLETLHQ